MSEKASLFIDEPELENVVLDFPNYINTLTELILTSKPSYTVGIYGGWGIGKTTLMKNVMKKLESNSCICIEFNAWRYSHEPRHATYPLMLDILGNILQQNEVKQFLKGGIGKRLLGGLVRVANGLSGSVKGGIPDVIEAELNIDLEKILQGEEDEISKLSTKTKPVFQEGMDLIKNLLSRMKGADENNDLKLVIFIDDLDRCTPEKATEIFESVKIFFDIPGLVFVFGLNQEIIEAAINYKYQHFNGKFNGKDYVKKIIQVPFPLPKWTTGDIIEFLQKLIDEYPNNQYRQFFKDNLGLIAKSIEKNPREIKRLLNNFIISYENHKNNVKIDRTKLFLLHVVANRWPEFYNDHMSNPHTLDYVRTRWDRMIDQIPDEEHQLDFNIDDLINKDSILKDITDLSSIMDFFQDSGIPLIEMKEDEWKEYRRATIIEPKMGGDKEQFDPAFFDKFKKPPFLDFSTLIGTSIRTETFWKYGGSVEQGKMPPALTQSFEVLSESTDDISFRYYVPVDFGKDKVSHNSDIKLHVSVDGEYIGSTPWLGFKDRSPPMPLKTDMVSVRLIKPGRHILTLQPETSASYLDNWGGTIDFY